MERIGEKIQDGKTVEYIESTCILQEVVGYGLKVL